MKYLKINDSYVKTVELPTEGLVSDIKVSDGKVVNSVTGTEFSNLFK